MAFTIYGVIALIVAVAACPTKPVSISISIYLILTGLYFAVLGKELEKLRKGLEKKAETK